jgi:hypothetical protein
VRGSPVSAKRSFLEKKGLTSTEIDEAFKRVPEAPAAAAVPAPATAAVPATTATPTYGANNLVTYTQQQPAHAAPASQALVSQPAQPGALMPLQQQQQLMAPPPQPVRWTQVRMRALGSAGTGQGNGCSDASSRSLPGGWLLHTCIACKHTSPHMMLADPQACIAGLQRSSCCCCCWKVSFVFYVT